MRIPIDDPRREAWAESHWWCEWCNDWHLRDGYGSDGSEPGECPVKAENEENDGECVTGHWQKEGEK